MTDMTVARTIVEQLGGNKFIVMTGAKNFCGSADGVSFQIPGKNFAKDSINGVQVTLTPADDYTVEFLRSRGTKITTVKKVDGVYCDMLQDVFLEATGLNTKLF